MIKKIKILPENLANKIAAGEVVNRPESVVKELVENSIDAGAQSIDVIIKNAGKTLIQVIDDGEGMSQEDAILSVQRHATSKISSLEDLEAILTFGFRGEALSSISSVSNLEIRTKRNEDDLGTVLRFEEDNQLRIEKDSFPVGTSIAVKNLFYNTPARRNFLKTNPTELKYIIDTFKKLSLSKPQIAFRFFNDDEIVFDYPKGDLLNRMESVFADNIFDAVIEAKEFTDYINIHGFVSKPTYLRKSKGEQYFFLNNRFVQSRNVNYAVFSAFENILDKGDYPFFVLFMDIDPKKVDVNVHPSKLEVKFDNEQEIVSFVRAVVKKAIGSYDLVPSMSFEGIPNGDNEKLKYSPNSQTYKNDFSDRPIDNSWRSEKRPSSVSDDDLDRLFGDLNKDIRLGSSTQQITSPFEESKQTEVFHHTASSETDTPFIVLLHNKYLLSQIKSGLMIIDAHVAHERILYEQALHSFDANIPFSQQLLFPQTVNLDPADYLLVKELEPYLTNLGFEIKFQAKNTIVIIGIPSDIKIEHEVEILMDILREFRNNQEQKQLELRDNLAKSYSCKAAIKAGDKISENEMRILVDKLFATSMPYVCPHGRPIVIKIPLEEFDKRFGRT